MHPDPMFSLGFSIPYFPYDLRMVVVKFRKFVQTEIITYFAMYAEVMTNIVEKI